MRPSLFFGGDGVGSAGIFLLNHGPSGFQEPLANFAGQPEGVVGPYETLVASALAGALNMAVTEPLWRACVIAQATVPAARKDATGFHGFQVSVWF